jgi:hypothetical protein
MRTRAYYALKHLQRPERNRIRRQTSTSSWPHTGPRSEKAKPRVDVGGSPFLAEAKLTTRPRGWLAHAVLLVVQPSDRREPRPEKVVG